VNNALLFILATFAVYRIAHLLARETGPFSIGERWRNLHTGEDWIGEGIRCVWCLSFWLALPVGLGLAGLRDGWWLWWLGIAGAVVALDQGVTK
jgi:hypothetical protein